MTEPVRMPQTDLYSSLTQGLEPKHEFTRSWLQQVILRMRRELTWLWRNHQPVDRFADALQRRSLAEERQKFFEEDPTAHYLNVRIKAGKTPQKARGGKRGTFPWLARDLSLTRAELFVTALALAGARDAALGNLIAMLHGDSRQQLPTLGLAQWLWDDTASLLPLMSSAHPLFARGILRRAESANEWSATISMPAIVAEILEGASRRTPSELERITGSSQNGSGKSPAAVESDAENVEIELLACRMKHSPSELHLVPISLPFASDTLHADRARPALSRISALTGRPVCAIRSNVVISPSVLENAGAYCWLLGTDLMLPAQGMASFANWQNLLRPFPIFVFAAAMDEAAVHEAQTLPVLKIRPLSYEGRRAIWRTELENHRLEADPEALRECAYRFRLDGVAIAEVASALSHSGSPVSLDRMTAACQQQVGQLIQAQASLVSPRFARNDLVLDAHPASQFDQLLSSMRSLSRVHADWGTGRVWSDAGISAMFAGAPGTGKTMAAEVLSAELRLPIYRVDLSQVVNKYIGETEKNLRKLFDAAEQADLILFFDEAESLFGQRMQARSSNDRFANLEVSYLLERMERFRGLAILATNRKKDLDEAFLRRLRYVIEFPMPARNERYAIWKKSIPPQVSTVGINFDFLAHEFALSGGNIRSIVLNACLQTASSQENPALGMDAIMTAIDREYEKIGRPLTREQKTQWRLNHGAGADVSGTEVRQ